MNTLQTTMILASASPRRCQLLEQLGLTFQVDAPSVDETPRPGESPEDYALRLSEEKAFQVSWRHPDSVVIGADTVVVLNGDLLGKPRDPDHARKILSKLSGQTHQVITGITVLWPPRRIYMNEAVVTEVTFKKLSREEIDNYVATGEPMDKAGAYGIQGKGALLVEKISGCYNNVVGLPLFTLGMLLEKAEIRLWSSESSPSPTPPRH